jgi:hypothetical protein
LLPLGAGALSLDELEELRPPEGVSLDDDDEDGMFSSGSR